MRTMCGTILAAVAAAAYNQGKKRNGMIAKSDRPDGPFAVCNWSSDDPDANGDPMKLRDK